MENGNRRRHHRVAEREVCRAESCGSRFSKKQKALVAGGLAAFVIIVFIKGILIGCWISSKN